MWRAWSDSYIVGFSLFDCGVEALSCGQREWLVGHGLMRSDAQKTRDDLVSSMSKYYYDTNNYVWDTWSDSEMRAWLIDNGVIKGDAKTLTRNKMLRLVE